MYRIYIFASVEKLRFQIIVYSVTNPDYKRQHRIDGRKRGIMLTNTNTNNKTVVIGIDHGYGNIKTANTCFRVGVAATDQEPIFAGDALTYGGKY